MSCFLAGGDSFVIKKHSTKIRYRCSKLAYDKLIAHNIKNEWMKFAMIDVGAKQFMIRHYFYSESICNEPIRFDSIHASFECEMWNVNANAKVIHIYYDVILCMDV